MKIGKLVVPLCLPFLLVACTTQDGSEKSPDLGALWVQNSAEYHAVSRQVYRTASMALPALIADKAWSAIPYQNNAENLPPAIIMDIDQTVVNGIDFELGYERPFTSTKHDAWNDSHVAMPVPGASEFVELARASGVQVFFLTGRPCSTTAESSCPPKSIAVQDLIEAGIPADEADVSLAGEQQDWGSEKKVRRDYIARNHRVIMLFGDDLGDFVPCVRRSPVAPCETGATIANRLALATEHDAYWGAGWYILPNPMYGSWTTVK